MARAVVAGHRHRPALTAADRTWTYAELWEHADEVARALLDRPVFGPQATVGLIGRNTREYIAAYVGVLRAGGTVVPLNERLQPGRDPRPARARRRVRRDRRRPGGRLERPSRRRASGLAALMRRDRSAARLAAARRRAPTPCILLTSGSTGRPKGVVHSHRAPLHSALRLAGALPFGPAERAIAFLPFFASMPGAGAPRAALRQPRWTCIDRFDPDRIARACATRTCFDAVPRSWRACLDEADHDDTAAPLVDLASRRSRCRSRCSSAGGLPSRTWPRTRSTE